MKKTVSVLATVALSLGFAASVQAAPVNANRVTKSVSVNYQCQEGSLNVRYGFNGAGIPVTATARVNGATRVMKYDQGRSDNVDISFKDARGYTLSGQAFELRNVRSAPVMITSPNNDMVYKDCSPR